MNNEVYPLNERNIDIISEKVRALLSKYGTDSKNKIRICFSIENILINWLNHFDGEQTVEFITGKKVFSPFIQLRLKGDYYDPIKADEDDFTRWSSNFIESLSYAPDFSYKSGTNIVQLYIEKKKINPIFKIAIAFAVSLIVGFLGLLIPEAQRTGILNWFVVPIYQKFLGVLDFITVPFIFLSVLCGIYGMGNSGFFGVLSKKIVSRFISLTTFAVILATVVFVPAFHLEYSSGSVDISLVAKCYQLILDMIPGNILVPFSETNILQVVLIAAIFGVILITLGESGKTVRKFFDELDRIVIRATGFLDKSIPVFVFVVVINLLWSGSLEQILSAIKPIVLFICFSLAFLVMTLLYTSVRAKVRPDILIKKMFPVLLIGMSTASSSAIHGENVSTCNKKYGINNKIVDFAIPMGMVTCMPATAVNFLVLALFFAEQTNVKVSVIWIINCILLCVITSVATPPVAGGAIACYSILFNHLGIPASALALAVTIDVFFDFIATTVDNALIQTQLILQTNNTDMLDRKVLLKPE